LHHCVFLLDDSWHCGSWSGTHYCAT